MFLSDAIKFLIQHPEFRKFLNTHNIPQNQLWGCDARAVIAKNHPNRFFVRIRLDFDRVENTSGDVLAIVEYFQNNSPFILRRIKMEDYIF